MISFILILSLNAIYATTDNNDDFSDNVQEITNETTGNKEVQLTIDNIQKNIDKDIKFNDELLNISNIYVK